MYLPAFHLPMEQEEEEREGGEGEEC